ncbi:MAG: vWA domain-containing protein [Bacteroidota bacterium]
MTFENQEFLYLWLLIIPAIAWYVLRNRVFNPSLQISGTLRLKQFNSSYKIYLRHVLFGLKILAFSSLVVVLARPQSVSKWKNVTTEGIDIVLTIDISGSMLARDFTPDRLEASKNIAMEFISGRPDDRIGLVVFSAESFTQCPLTTDHAVLMNLFGEVKSGMIEDGTAIGMGLATAVNRLKNSEAKSKVIILLTDGVNNSGSIAPVTAAELAERYGIRVYTVGVGTRGMAPYPVHTPFGTRYQDVEVEIDEDALQEIARLTNGQYFRATDNESLVEIYKQIDSLEKSKIDVKEYSEKQEEYTWFILVALILLLADFSVRYTLLRSTP